MPLLPPATGRVDETPSDEETQVEDAQSPRGETVNRPDSPSRIRVKNRRKRYLDLNPDYFTSSHLELADPLLYDRLIRRFQTPAEREAEGRRKGYSGTLEADLLRSEAKMEALAHPDANDVAFSYRRGVDGEILAEEKDEVPRDKEQGFHTWKWEMEMRFIRGGDGDFDYDPVDRTEEFDDRWVEEREAEEKWFDEEEARFVDGHENSEMGSKNDSELEGETGVQDF